jgi:hypothetical protein
MRHPSDRIMVNVSLLAIADLDLERIEEDPVWEMIRVNAPDQETALGSYIAHYLRNVLLFTNMPSTNGPSSVFIEKVEVANGTEQVEGQSHANSDHK